jgi:hypothetical protein
MQMPTVRIDDDVYQALRELAVPFEDKPNDVIRRLLDHREVHKGPRVVPVRRASKPDRLETGKKTPQGAYRVPILRTLVDMGGRGKVDEVLIRVERMMGSDLNALDRGTVGYGQPRWRNSAMWERKQMLDEGLLKDGSERGVWEVSDKGRKYLEQGRSI